MGNLDAIAVKTELRESMVRAIKLKQVIMDFISLVFKTPFISLIHNRKRNTVDLNEAEIT